MPFQATTVAGKILKNSLWYGLETLLETVVFLGTSIAVARYLGPTKLGYFSYINFFVTIVTRTSGTGMASATRKYMADFLAQDEPGMARAVYRLAYRYQLLGICTIALLSLGAVFLFGDPNYRLMSSILVLSIVPGLMSWVPASANQAFEDIAPNTISAVFYILSYGIVILLTIHFGWDLVGIASALFIGRTVEVILRTIPLNRKLAAMPLSELDPSVIAQVRRFCLETIGIQLLMSIVWDRSEMIFLKAYSGLEQIAFYSVSFGLATNLLVVPRTFGSATGISLMVEASRDALRVDSIVRNACRYLLFVALPVHIGAAAITRSALGFAYGPKYAAAVPVLAIASLLAIPRAFQEIPETLIKVADRQKHMLYLFILTGALNLGLDWLLIPRYGAVGAALANGLSQTFGITAIWQLSRRLFPFKFPVGSALRLSLAAGIMGAGAFFLTHLIPGLAGIIVAVGVSIPVYAGLVKLFHGLTGDDRLRFDAIGDRLPGALRSPYRAAIAFATPDPEPEVEPS